MKVLLNEAGYVESYALEGELLEAVEFVLSYRFDRFLICLWTPDYWCRAPPSKSLKTIHFSNSWR